MPDAMEATNASGERWRVEAVTIRRQQWYTITGPGAEHTHLTIASVERILREHGVDADLQPAERAA